MWHSPGSIRARRVTRELEQQHAEHSSSRSAARCAARRGPFGHRRDDAAREATERARENAVAAHPGRGNERRLHVQGHQRAAAPNGSDRVVADADCPRTRGHKDVGHRHRSDAVSGQAVVRDAMSSSAPDTTQSAAAGAILEAVADKSEPDSRLRSKRRAARNEQLTRRVAEDTRVDGKPVGARSESSGAPAPLTTAMWPASRSTAMARWARVSHDAESRDDVTHGI